MRGGGGSRVVLTALTAALVVAGPVGGAPLGSTQTYTDARADAAAPAVDLTTIVASNDDAATITFRVTLDRAVLGASDVVDVYVDTDRNRATGDRGADARLSAQAGSVRLMRPIAGGWYPVTATTVRSAVSGGVLTMTAAQRELERLPLITANPGFAFYVTTSAGDAPGDVAPDAALTGDARYGYAIKIADKLAPTLKTLASSGKRGTIVRLKYMVHDRSGKTRERGTVYRGTRPVATVSSSLGPSRIGVTYYIRWRAPTTLRAGSYRFCLRSTDVAGNRSARSCASLRLT